MTTELFAAFETDDPKVIAEAILEQEFSLVDVGEDESAEEHNALVAELDDFAGIVSFTGETFAQQFANTVEEALNKEGELPCFVVQGRDFLDLIPDDIGILLNAESEECYIFPPEFVQEIKSHCVAS